MTSLDLEDSKFLILLTNLAIDVYYSDSCSRVVGVLFNSATSQVPGKIVSCESKIYSPYIPGEFWKRELPCILDLYREHPEIKTARTIIVDGLAILPGGVPGLGKKLWEALGSDKKTGVIGLAKSYFGGAEDVAVGIWRGKSGIPLWVNACGALGNEVAAEFIKKMPGKYRLPDILRTLDKETKSLIVDES